MQNGPFNQGGVSFENKTVDDCQSKCSAVAILAINYNDQVEEQTKNAQNEIKQKTKEAEETEIAGGDSSTNSGDSVLTNNQSDAAANEGVAATESPGNEAGASTTDNTAVDPSTVPEETSPQPQPAAGGLNFATREEAIAFGFNRFTVEEIEIYPTLNGQ